MAETVSFYPTKKLFIDVLTRDISIRDCIFDLLDNAVDSYTRNRLSETRHVRVNFTSERFEIMDECGGIRKDQLLNEVFRFGLLDLSVKAETIGVYGIGLKRSIFKIGRNILLETDDGRDYCKLEIGVDEWIEDDKNWDIELTETSGSRLNGSKPYTLLRITDLRDEAKDLFDSPLFETTLKETASIYYSLYISNSEVQFFINDEELPGFEIKIRASEDYRPVRYRETYGDVRLEIICWLDVSDAEEKRKRREKGKIGWNVYMNKRLVILDDTSPDTGWRGTKPYLPRYHPIFYQFVGIVFLSTDQPYKLPVNTSKNNFNTESRIYQHLIIRMCDVARPLIDYLADKYERTKRRMDITERTAVEDIKNDTDEQSKHLKESTLADAEYVEEFIPPPMVERPKIAETTIRYRKAKERVELVKKILDVASNWEVGSETFEYFWDGQGLDDVK